MFNTFLKRTLINRERKQDFKIKRVVGYRELASSTKYDFLSTQCSFVFFSKEKSQMNRCA
jgi:hypothetical protein